MKYFERLKGILTMIINSILKYEKEKIQNKEDFE